MKAISLEVNQTLHGYSKGHSLLESSLLLSPKDERRMLRLSDMSGSSMTKGFENYITGYPLIDKDAFVVARTWYAPEVSRPGCVWTHSFIIDTKYLEVIRTLRPLVNFFIRPNDNWNSKQYREPKFINFETEDFNENDGDFTAWVGRRETIYSVFNYPEKSIFIVSDASSRLENFVFKIWDYQWADLRRRFAFCTGSIENRNSSELLFDLQVIPERNKNSISRRSPDGIIISDHILTEKSYPNWVNYLDRQFISSSKEAVFFQNYLNLTGRDLVNGRFDYVKLVKIYTAIRENAISKYETISNVLEDVSREFPSPNEGVNLKSTLFGGEDKLADLGIFSWSESDVLRVLCSSKNEYSLNPQTLRIYERVQELLEKNPKIALELIIEILASKPNRFGEDVILTVCKNLDSEKVLFLANQNDQILYLLLHNYPKITLQANIWDIEISDLKERLNMLLSSPKLTKEDRVSVTNLALKNDISTVIGKLFDDDPELTVITMLDWLQHQPREIQMPMIDRWRYQLAAQSSYIVVWLSKISWDLSTAKLFCYFVDSLNSNSKDVTNPGAKFWSKCLKDNEGLNLSEKIRLYSFLFAVAIRTNDGDDTARLLAETFLVVHNAARDDLLPYESWRQSSDRLPELAWFQSWDKCERLRRGYLEEFSYKDFSPIYFFQGIDQREVFEKILQYSDDNKKVRKFIHKMANKLPSKKEYLSNMQIQLLIKYEID